MRTWPSPCVDVCRYELDGHCVQCAMTKAQKSTFGALRRPSAQEAFLRDLAAQQTALLARFPDARFRMWRTAYAHKCRAFGKASPVPDED
jgi:predicted Fe-S protein YdhL (DUF1289 family)